MAEFEYVPEDRRQKIEDLLARGQSSRAIELLEVSVRQFAVTRWAMQLLGELQLKAGNRDQAGFASSGLECEVMPSISAASTVGCARCAGSHGAL